MQLWCNSEEVNIRKGKLCTLHFALTVINTLFITIINTFIAYVMFMWLTASNYSEIILTERKMQTENLIVMAWDWIMMSVKRALLKRCGRYCSERKSEEITKTWQKLISLVGPQADHLDIHFILQPAVSRPGLAFYPSPMMSPHTPSHQLWTQLPQRGRTKLPWIHFAALTVFMWRRQVQDNERITERIWSDPQLINLTAKYEE